MFPWYAFLTYAVITAATPGPNNIMSMSNAGRLGFRRALPFNFGIWVGFTIVMVLCTLFCTALSGCPCWCWGRPICSIWPGAPSAAPT